MFIILGYPFVSFLMSVGEMYQNPPLKTKINKKNWKKHTQKKESGYMRYMGVSKNKGTPKWMVYKFENKPY